MTNTIHNVPRELLADLLGNDHDKRIMAERHLLAMLANAPSPAGVDADHVEDVRAMVADPSPDGVDGLEVATFLHTLHMELGQTEQFCSKWKGDPFGVSGVDYSSTYSVTSEPLCRLSDAQAIIDGLRGELEAAGEILAQQGRRNTELRKMRDQQAQRICELEGLLRDCYPGCGLTARQTQIIRARIDAALSAGKEGE